MPRSRRTSATGTTPPTPEAPRQARIREALADRPSGAVLVATPDAFGFLREVELPALHPHTFTLHPVEAPCPARP